MDFYLTPKILIKQYLALHVTLLSIIKQDNACAMGKFEQSFSQGGIYKRHCLLHTVMECHVSHAQYQQGHFLAKSFPEKYFASIQCCLGCLWDLIPGLLVYLCKFFSF